MSDDERDFGSPVDGNDTIAQMDEDEDDLLGPGASLGGSVADKEEDMEYDEHDDEGPEDESGEVSDDAMAEIEKKATEKSEAGQKAKRPRVAQPEAVSEENKGSTGDELDIEEAYTMRNNVGHLVPLCEDKKGPGRVRDFGGVVEVADNDILGSMDKHKNWPSPDQLDPKAIVVIKAKHKEDDVLEATEKKGPYGWYARVILRSERDDNSCMNRKILKLVPKKVVKDFLLFLSNHKELSRSSLITKYQPEYENAKPFPVAPNGWKKCTGIKSTGVPAKKEPKLSKEVTHEEDTGPVKKRPFEDDDIESEFEKPCHASPIKATKQIAKSSDDPPAAPTKKPFAPHPDKKPAPVSKKGIINFAKSSKPSDSSAPDQITRNLAPAVATSSGKRSVESGSSSAEPLKKMKHVEEDAPGCITDNHSSIVGSKRPLNLSDDHATDCKSVAFKRVRTIEVESTEKSITFWKGNILYIAEL